MTNTEKLLCQELLADCKANHVTLIRMDKKTLRAFSSSPISPILIERIKGLADQLMEIIQENKDEVSLSA